MRGSALLATITLCAGLAAGVLSVLMLFLVQVGTDGQVCSRESGGVMQCTSTGGSYDVSLAIMLVIGAAMALVAVMGAVQSARSLGTSTFGLSALWCGTLGLSAMTVLTSGAFVLPAFLGWCAAFAATWLANRNRQTAVPSGA